MSSDDHRNAAVVALTLLEVIRAQDLPTEVLEDEDPSITLPRRLGLSEVVEQQIGRYRTEVRKRRRLSDGEVGDLFQLVLRRPDSEDVFFQAGEMLVGRDLSPRGLGGVLFGKLYSRRLAYALARRQVRRRLKSLFGRSLGGFGKGPFSLEGHSLLFVRHDPGGDACEMMSGLCQATLQRYIRRPVVVVHSFCQARGDPFCRWVAREDKTRSVTESVAADDEETAVGDPDLHPESSGSGDEGTEERGTGT